MPSAASLTPESRFMGLFIGPKHSGKTCAALSFPTPSHDYDFDGRIRGILGAPWIDKSKITYDFFPPRELGLIDKIDKSLETFMTSAKIGQPVPTTIVLDSLTSECLAMIQQSLPLTHNQGKGKKVGTVNMVGPEDYGVEANVTYQIMAGLRTLPVPNIIVTAHTIERFGKANPDDPYSESIVVGEKLSVRDKIGENIKIYFDHIFRFDRRIVGGQERFFVKFRSDIACTSYSELPHGEIDITGKSFYEVLMSYVKVKEAVNG